MAFRTWLLFGQRQVVAQEVNTTTQPGNGPQTDVGNDLSNNNTAVVHLSNVGSGAATNGFPLLVQPQGGLVQVFQPNHPAALMGSNDDGGVGFAALLQSLTQGGNTLGLPIPITNGLLHGFATVQQAVAAPLQVVNNPATLASQHVASVNAARAQLHAMSNARQAARAVVQQVPTSYFTGSWSNFSFQGIVIGVAIVVGAGLVVVGIYYFTGHVSVPSGLSSSTAALTPSVIYPSEVPPDFYIPQHIGLSSPGGAPRQGVWPGALFRIFEIFQEFGRRSR